MPKVNPVFTFAEDIPLKTDYLFDSYDSIRHEDPEYSEGAGTERPKDKVIVRDQKSTPACTCFAEGHITNGNNVLEDARIGESRPQTNPAMPRDEFCSNRNNRSTGTSIQTMAQFFKNKKFIQGYVTIPVNDSDPVTKMKKAIDGGNFIATGCSNCDWGITGKTGVFTLRTDGKFVGHSFAIVSYDNDSFRAINSRGSKRGPLGGYFKIPLYLVNKLYSKLCIIDFNDAVYFQMLKDREKLSQFLSLAKELYAGGSSNVRDYFDGIKISENMNKLYGIIK